VHPKTSSSTPDKRRKKMAKALKKVHIGSRSATSLVIFGHGLGDTPAGWTDACEIWQKRLPHVRFVLPEAPIQPVSLNGGARMNSWYDIPADWDRDRHKTPAPGIDESSDAWEALVKAEAGPDTKVVLAGFSQGGAMSLYTAARGNIKNLAGVVALSGYLPPTENLKFPYKALLCHGTADQVVPFENAKSSKKLLEDAGADVRLLTYQMDHSASMEEINDVYDFLKTILPPPEKGEL